MAITATIVSAEAGTLTNRIVVEIAVDGNVLERRSITAQNLDDAKHQIRAFIERINRVEPISTGPVDLSPPPEVQPAPPTQDELDLEDWLRLLRRWRRFKAQLELGLSTQAEVDQARNIVNNRFRAAYSEYLE